MTQVREQFISSGLQTRAVKDGKKRYIEGYAAVFGQRSKLINDWDGQYFEVIERGAFDDVLSREDLNVIFTKHHDFSYPIARTKNGTLELTIDDKGLKFRAEVPDGVSYAEDLYKMIERGDYYENSFMFTVDKDGVRYEQLSEDGKEITVRHITKFAGLYDVSTVLDGAYSNTDIETKRRSFEQVLPTWQRDSQARKRQLSDLEKSYRAERIKTLEMYYL